MIGQPHTDGCNRRRRCRSKRHDRGAGKLAGKVVAGESLPASEPGPAAAGALPLHLLARRERDRSGLARPFAREVSMGGVTMGGAGRRHVTVTIR